MGEQRTSRSFANANGEPMVFHERTGELLLSGFLLNKCVSRREIPVIPRRMAIPLHFTFTFTKGANKRLLYS